MSITFHPEHNTIKLDSSRFSYILKIYEQNYILNIYYGAPIPDAYIPKREQRYPNASFSPSDPIIGEIGHRFRPDTTPLEYSGSGAGDFREPCLALRNANGDTVTDLRYDGHKIYAGKPEIPGQPSTYANTPDEAETLELYAKDPTTGLRVILYYTVFDAAGVMTRRVRVENPTDKACDIERVFSMCVDLPTMDYDMISLWGRHNHERYTQRVPLHHGLQGVESRRGVSGHTYNPFMALAAHGADENQGWVYGFNLVYSGNFSAHAECDFNGCTRVTMGINPVDFGWHLDPGEFFDAPEVVMVFTDGGIGEMSRVFHRFYNENLIRGRWKREKRPLLINSWEAAYFDFNSDKLVAFAHEAKKLGIEMLVMDDGWFGVRNRDNCSLGDWYVNEDKLPGGLTPLIERVNAEGLKFGIWFEPEMISPDSDLFRAHPDWHVHVEGRPSMPARFQYVLDVSREDVRENIWQQLYAILANNKIDYVKWDFNRNLSEAGSALLPPERKKEFFHRFILGTYDLMDRLVKTFPDILFENCSGGGGRFDPAMLAYSPQIWASDNTDPIERLDIQFGTSMCYPASTMGAHVSANRRAGYVTKGNVAMWGTFGYELDPVKLTDEEREIIRGQVADYHRYYDLIHYGDLYRLISPAENERRAAWMFVSPDKSEALFTLVTTRSVFRLPLIIKFRGLDAKAMYRIQETDEILSGAALMNAGYWFIDVPMADKESYTLHLERV
ncbi:MAG: alpha-galactosidase [Clostridia bacterium]|nr:alpha-galactosidase [Clostridia bacterium]